MRYRRSSFCSSGGCVEVNHTSGVVLVRDSKNDQLEPLSFQPTEWMSTILAPIMLGRLPRTVGVVTVYDTDVYEWDGHTVDGQHQTLHFTPEEWEAFVKGVQAREFDVPPGVIGSG